VSCHASHDNLERFRAVITQTIGLHFDDAKLGFLGEVLQRRLDRLGRSCDAYIWLLGQEAGCAEIAALARELTVGETYFFRNIEQFRALSEVALPQRMSAARAGPKVLRLLSAGCASGEEAYSLAMVAREAVADPAWKVEIRAVDLNPAVLEKAARGRYSSWALRETPPDTQRKWFRREGGEVQLDEAVRAAVTFEGANLASDNPQLWPPATYDVIFCRNVLMYFAPEKMRAVIARIAQSLAPGGFLFLGHAETLRGISDAFHLRHTHGTFYYERKGSYEQARVRAASTGPQPAVAGALAVAADDAWFHAIARATERVAALVPEPSDSDAAPASSPAARGWDVERALELMRSERFAEALTYVRSGPVAAGRDPDMLLLEAALLVQGQDIEAAEAVCLRLLKLDELNAGAHYALGLCREQSRDVDGAMEHYRVATYLDPEFAMPRLHLGLLARRAGERDAARRELGQALFLLEREDAGRLLLFGGGFNREALMRLCASALGDGGARA
jgi:chemotaxis protein methyltransferase CheR